MKMKKITLFFLLLTSFCSFAQNVTLQGYAYKNGLSDHTGIKVILNRTTPSIYTDTITTDATGFFTKLVPMGIYNIKYYNDLYPFPTGYFYQKNCYSNQTLSTVNLFPKNGIVPTGSYYPGITPTIGINDTLKIQPGAKFYFLEGAGILNSGVINAIGNATDSILFSIYPNSTAGDICWVGSNYKYSTFSYCQFAEPSITWSSLTNTYLYLSISNSKFFGNSSLENTNINAWLWNEDLQIYNCSFKNKVWYQVVDVNGKATFKNCIFKNGVVSSAQGLANFKNCIFENYCIWQGGSNGPKYRFYNCLFTKINNQTMFNSSTSKSVLVRNSIFLNNINSTVIQGNWDIQSSCFYNNGLNSSGSYPNFGTIVGVNSHNDSIDQYLNIFVNPKLTDTTGGNYYPINSSPIIDAGDNLSVVDTTDFNGNLRVRDGNKDGQFVVDMGPYEYNFDTDTNNCINPLNGGIITGDQSICSGVVADTLRNISYPVDFTGNLIYQWQSSADSISFSDVAGANSSFFVPGTLTASKWYKRLAKVSCQSNWKESNILKIIVNSLPADAGTITGSQHICSGGTIFSYSTSPILNATSYQWTLPSGSSGTSSTNSISVNYGVNASSGNISVKGSNSCGDGSISNLAVTVINLPGKPGKPNGVISTCGSDVDSYSTSGSNGAITYYWMVNPSGAGSYSANTSSSNTSITWNPNFSGIAKVTVKGMNQCGTGQVSDTLTLTVSPLPSPAGAIVGSQSISQGQSSVTYTVPTIANATTYIWTLPSGATGNSYSNSITVNYGISAISGYIKVKGNNACGGGVESSLYIEVNSVNLNSGLIAYYPFSGSTHDSTGNNQDAVIHGNVIPVSDRFGNPNGAYYFGGNASGSDYMTVEHSNYLKLQNPFSLSAWVKKSAHGGYVLIKGRDIINAYSIADGSGNAFVVYGSANNGAGVANNTSISLNEWHLYTFVTNGDSAYFYLDGQCIDRKMMESNSFMSTSDNYPLSIGRHFTNCCYNPDPPMWSYPFNGVIDDIMIYSRAISSSEVDSIYHKGGWPFIKLDITAYLEGLYSNTTNEMNVAYDGNTNSPKWSNNVADKIDIELHSEVHPHGAVFNQRNVDLSINGTASINVPSTFNSNYYIGIKNRNHLETWSAIPIPFNTYSVAYDFTSSMLQAYGIGTQTLVSSNKYAFIAGDVNQDGMIDLNDFIVFEPELISGTMGFNVTDFNGSGYVDLDDFVVFEPRLAQDHISQTP